MRYQMVTIRAGISTTASQIQRIALILLCLGLGWATPAQAQGTNIPWVPIQFLNASGAVCNACTLDTWAAGTSTAEATYSDSALTTANANPVVMDSSGRPTSGGLYLSATSYRFRLRTSAGATIWTLDNITSVPTASGNVDVSCVAGEAIALGQVVYLSDGSGSLTTGRCYLADSDNTYSSTTAPIVGIATAAIASAATGTIRIAGRMTGLTGLTAGESYFISATAGSLTSTPPTNARFIGGADTTTTLMFGGETGSVRVTDSDGTHHYVVRTNADLTADRIVTMNFGNATGVITNNPLNIAEGRCTLTSATPVTTADVTAATTIYYALYTGNRLALYDGSAQWNVVTLTELSLAVPATTNTMYDVFVDYTAGAPALEAVAWTNDTTRATALATQNGVYVQTSDTDSRYVCSFRTTGSSGQTENSFTKRYVWNYYNRIRCPIRVTDTTNSWTYTTATYRQANGSAANQVDIVNGVAEAPISLTAVHLFTSDAAGRNAATGIGEDATTLATGVVNAPGTASVAAYYTPLTASLYKFPAIGRHFYTWLEIALTAAGTGTWYGDDNSTNFQTGLHGVWEC